MEGEDHRNKRKEIERNLSVGDRIYEMENGNGSDVLLDRRKTIMMNFEGLGEFDDEEIDRYFETHDRLSSALSLEMTSSSTDEEDYDDCRISFSSAVSSLTTASRKFSTPAMSPDYDIWMAAPGSISERRRRLLHGMGLASSNKNLLRAVSIQRAASKKAMIASKGGDQKKNRAAAVDLNLEEQQRQEQTQEPAQRTPMVPILLVRSRSDSDIEMCSADKRRKEEFLGKISKQSLTRTSSTIAAPCNRIRPHHTPARASPMARRKGRGASQGGAAALTPMISNTRFGAFFLIKNLDTGKEFIVNGYDEDGMWNRVSDLQTGKQLTMEEFEKCVGYSPIVKELMRRENVNRMNYDLVPDIRKFNSYLSKSLRMSKRRGAALFKNIVGGVAHSMSLKVTDKDVNDIGISSPKIGADNKHGKGNQWVKVRQTGKSHKELSALHLCQEVQAHEGSIWTIKFSLDAHYLASAGEDRVIHIWEVQECELMAVNDGGLTPVHPSLADSMERQPGVGEVAVMSMEKKKKGRRKGNQIPDYVHAPETVFSLSEKPVCSLNGHLDDILDLSWSKSQLLLSSSMDKTVRLWDLETKSCLKLFAHNDYVTCIQFNPMDENYFISGSLDTKVRIWSIPDRQVVDWSDLHEMVTAVSYTPDGQGALVGSHRGICRAYNTEDCKLSQTNQIDVQKTKKPQAKKKITGFQFSPVNPSEVLLTSADSRIRVLDGSEVIHKLKGLRNTSSQISASYSLDGKYIICASEDSNVYIWRSEDQRTTSTGKRTVLTTTSHEHFQCKDVSVAIPWHGHVRGEPPPVQIHSKRHSKRISASNPFSASSPTKEEGAISTANNKKPVLPPLPKKHANQVERTVTPTEEELGQICSAELGNRESSPSNSLSLMRAGGDSSSSSIRHGIDFNSSSIRRDADPNYGSIRHGGDSPGLSSRFGDSLSTNLSSRVSSWSWFDGGNHVTQTIQPTAWGMVIVTATLTGEIRAYQNFGLPRRIGRQPTLFS